jgi:DNA-binding GntR family transcriptional regulator
MIDRRRRRAVYLQIADDIADKIRRDTLPPGADLPSADVICRTYGVGMTTAARALRELEHAGLIDTEPGRVAKVRVPRVLETVWLEPGERVSYRPADPDDVERWSLPLGVPMLVVTQLNHWRREYPADRFEAQVPRPDTRPRRSGASSD